MRKKLLNIEYDYDFVLIAICCHSKDYRLCWEINKRLNIKLEKGNDIKIEIPSKVSKKENERESQDYSLFFYDDEENSIYYNVFSNISVKGRFLPEQKQVDYFLHVKGYLITERKKEIIKKLKSIPFVLTVYEIDPKKLKSKQNLLCL